jgi:glycerophosphoryl diester phosphodiesterase
MSYFAPPCPRVFGHRGAASLAPENTLPSFAVAAALGVGYLELDVHASRDGEVVVIHDAALDRTTDGSGPVRDHTWAQLAALDAGHRFSHDQRDFPFRAQGVRIPRLRGILGAFPELGINIEIKQADPPIVDAVLEAIGAARAEDRCLLTAEDDQIMAAIRRGADAGLATGMSTEDVRAFLDRLWRDDWRDYQPPGRALQVPPAYAGIEIITEASVAAAHRLGLEVHAWTINDAADVERLLALGVDGIISDRPGLVAQIARRYRA